MRRLAVVTPDAGFVQRARQAVAAEVVHLAWAPEFDTADPAAALARITASGPDVVCLGPDLPLTPLLDIAHGLDTGHPDCCVVMVAEASPEVLRHAVRAGVRDVLRPSVAPSELGHALNQAWETAQRRRATVSQLVAARTPAKVVTVVSPKGGSGKTMVATNLAVGLARLGQGEVALIDLDAQFGDVAAALALNPEQTLGDMAASTVPIDATTLKVFLTTHPSGLHTLCAPDSPAEGDEVTHEHAAHAVDLLASELAFVVVDTAAGLDALTLAAVERSTDLVLVYSLDVASVRGLRKEVDALDRLGLDGARRHYVLNRSSSKVGLRVRDVETFIGARAHVTLPMTKEVPVAMNEGVLVLETKPRLPISRELSRLVKLVAEGEPVSRRERRRLRRAG